MEAFIDHVRSEPRPIGVSTARDYLNDLQAPCFLTPVAATLPTLFRALADGPDPGGANPGVGHAGLVIR
jgi:hypothetical protein